MYAPVTGFAVRLVPPAASASGSEAGRLTSLTGVDEPLPVAPSSPDATTTVTWRPTAYFSAEFMVASSALVQEPSPTLKSWPMPLWDITSPLRTATRTYAANVAANFAGVLTCAVPTRISRMVASGATACTSSVSSTSSTPASHGEADGPPRP